MRIGDGWALYRGPAFETERHAHHAIQLCIGREGDLRVAVSPRWRRERTRGAWIAPDAPHEIDGEGRTVVLLYLEPESGVGGRVLEACAGRNLVRVDDGRAAALAIGLDRLTTMPSADVPGALAALFGAPSVEAHLDPRIATAIRLLGRADGSYPTSAVVARMVACSVGRFRHLFREQIGLAYRTYLLWLRLGVALEAIAAGASLTDAAHDAGFADSAHLSRTYRRMFGISPSSLAPSQPGIRSAAPVSRRRRHGSL